MTNPLAVESVDVLYRGQFDGGLELRADADDAATLTGHFSKFNNWYRIESYLEGLFLERCAPGSYKRTIQNNRNAMTVAFDHGYDPQIGDKPLGPIDVLEEDSVGARYEVPLLDTDYNRNFVLPALQGRTIDGRKFGSVLGASFRFRVISDTWNMEPGESDHNPEGIPERTINECRVFEFGPVVYPANPEATAGVRCLTDHYFERSLARTGRSRSAAQSIAPNIDPSTPGQATVDTSNPTDPQTHSADDPTTRSANDILLALSASR